MVLRGDHSSLSLQSCTVRDPGPSVRLPNEISVWGAPCSCAQMQKPHLHQREYQGASLTEHTKEQPQPWHYLPFGCHPHAVSQAVWQLLVKGLHWLIYPGKWALEAVSCVKQFRPQVEAHGPNGDCGHKDDLQETLSRQHFYNKYFSTLLT